LFDNDKRLADYTPAEWDTFLHGKESKIVYRTKGVAGSGKSTLINGAFLPSHPESSVIDQSAVGTSIRSNPATYTGMMDEIRRLFAAANKVSASLFNFKGACSNCQGLGMIYTDLAFLEPIRTMRLFFSY
jgi:excinuclease UvrABC ATPase subunit